MASLGTKKHYRPPEADSDTFDTQQEFLNSLNPVSIDSVAEYNRRCAHCWKGYGESDPGLDNAEAPVKLRCSHVFGEKCLKEIFSLPEPTRIDLVQMSFEPGSKGAELGRRLSAYVDQCGVDKGSLLIGGRREKDFARLLSQLVTSNDGYETLGENWSPLLMQAVNTQQDVAEIHILENALILDANAPVVKKKPNPSAYGTTPPASISFGMPPDIFASIYSSQPAHTGFESFISSLTPGQYLYEAASKAASETSSSSSASIENMGHSGNEATLTVDSSTDHLSQMQNTNPSTIWPSLVPHESVDQEKAGFKKILALLAAGHGDLISSSKKANPTLNTPAESANSLGSHSKQVSGAKPTNSDKEAKSEATDSEVLELEAKLKKTLQELGDPMLAPYVPLPLVIDMSTNLTTAAHFKVPELLKCVAKLTGVDQEEDFKNSLEDHLQEFPPSKTNTNATKAWKDQMPEQSNIDKLVFLQKMKGKAENALLNAQKSQASAKAKEELHMQTVRKRQNKMAEEREARRREMISILARALTKVYNDYEQHQYNVALAAGQPPPVKKLKLAPRKADKMSPMSDPVGFAPPLSNVINVSAMIHQDDFGAKQYDVPQPYIFGASYPGDYDDEDEMPDEQEVDYASKTIFLTRTICRLCFENSSVSQRSLSSFPECVVWKDNKNVPDGCPLCQKVLFKKGPTKSGLGGGKCVVEK